MSTPSPAEATDKRLCLYDPDKNEIFFCVKETTIIGRDQTCDLAIIGDRSVSRLHAYLTVSEEAASIKDLSSTNGTFKNGVRVKAVEALSKGDEISFGLKRYIIVPVKEGERLAQAGIGQSLTTVIDHESSNNLPFDDTSRLSNFVKGTPKAPAASHDKRKRPAKSRL